MRRPGSKAGLLFRLVVPAVVVFIATILALIAIVFGDQQAPVVGWLDQNGGWLLTVEFIIIVALTLIAMTADRIRTLMSPPGTSPSPAADPSLPSSDTDSRPSH